MLIEIACLLLGATTIGVSHVFPYFQGAGGLASIIASCLLIYKRGDLRTLCDRVIGVVLYLLAALTHASAITVIVMLHIHEVAVAELVESQCHAAGCTVLHAANMSTICEQVYVFESAFTEVQCAAAIARNDTYNSSYVLLIWVAVVVCGAALLAETVGVCSTVLTATQGQARGPGLASHKEGGVTLEGTERGQQSAEAETERA